MLCPEYNVRSLFQLSLIHTIYKFSFSFTLTTSSKVSTNGNKAYRASLTNNKHTTTKTGTKTNTEHKSNYAQNTVYNKCKITLLHRKPYNKCLKEEWWQVCQMEYNQGIQLQKNKC